MSNHAENQELWTTWRKNKTNAFNYLLDHLFKCWNMNKENEFRGYIPDDLIFSHYHSAIGITDKWEQKEFYSFSINSYLWFSGRVYNEYQENEDLFIQKYTRKLVSNGVHVIYQDLVIPENIFE
jgi:hypothetical protein